MVEKKDEMMSVMADALANTKARHPDCRGPFKIEFPEDRVTTPTATELVEALKASMALIDRIMHVHVAPDMCGENYVKESQNWFMQNGGSLWCIATQQEANRAALTEAGRSALKQERECPAHDGEKT